MSTRRLVPAALASLVALVPLVVGLGSAGAKQAPSTRDVPKASKVIMFASDGMRPDLVDRYAKSGAMPTMRAVMREGSKGVNGLKQGFPPNTGVGWYTLATGTWPGEHGSTNNTFHRTGDLFTNRTSFATTGILQADTIQQAAERAGKTVVSVEWVGSRNIEPALSGPVVDFRGFYSDRGVLVNYDLPGQPALSNQFGVTYQRVTLTTATGYVGAPDVVQPGARAAAEGRRTRRSRRRRTSTASTTSTSTTRPTTARRTTTACMVIPAEAMKNAAAGGLEPRRERVGRGQGAARPARAPARRRAST